MVIEILAVCITVFILFLPLVSAKAAELRERTRKLELENDIVEYELDKHEH
jgi:hypothetical protein